MRRRKSIVQMGVKPAERIEKLKSRLEIQKSKLEALERETPRNAKKISDARIRIRRIIEEIESWSSV